MRTAVIGDVSVNTHFIDRFAVEATISSDGDAVQYPFITCYFAHLVMTFEQYGREGVLFLSRTVGLCMGDDRVAALSQPFRLGHQVLFIFSETRFIPGFANIRSTACSPCISFLLARFARLAPLHHQQAQHDRQRHQHWSQQRLHS